MARPAVVVLLSAFMVACDYPTNTSPSEPMTLTFEPDSATRTGVLIPNTGFRCDIDMTIVAHGRGDHLLTLQSIASTFYDTTGVTAASTIHSVPNVWFGVSSLKRDETATAHRQPTGLGPFLLKNEVTYTDQFGTAKTTTFTMKCVT